MSISQALILFLFAFNTLAVLFLNKAAVYFRKMNQAVGNIELN